MTRLYTHAHKITTTEYFVNVSVQQCITILAYRKLLVWPRRGISITSRVRKRIYGKLKIAVFPTLTVNVTLCIGMNNDELETAR
jgi:hypothetical protein